MSNLEQESWELVDAVTAQLGIAGDTRHCWIDSKGLPAPRNRRRWEPELSEVDQWNRASGSGGKPIADDPDGKDKE